MTAEKKNTPVKAATPKPEAIKSSEAVAVITPAVKTKTPAVEPVEVKKPAETKPTAAPVVQKEIVEPAKVDKPAEVKPAAAPVAQKKKTKAKTTKPKPTKKKETGVKMTDPKATKEAVEAAVAAGKETVDTVVKAGADAASQSVEQAVAMTQEQVAAAVKAGSEVFENYEDVVAFNKDNLDAVVSANATLVKGFQTLNTEFFAIVQASLEQNAKVAQKIFSCTSVQEVVAVQNDLLKNNYTAVLDKGRKLNDLTVKVAEESVAPLTTRVNVAVEKMTKPLAA